MSTYVGNRLDGRWHRLSDEPDECLEPSITFQWRRAGYGLTREPELTLCDVQRLPVDRLEAARAELDRLITSSRGGRAG